MNYIDKYTKWIYKHKMDDEGKIIWHKTWLVAVGSNQKDAIDFTKTFAPDVTGHNPYYSIHFCNQSLEVTST